MVEQVEPRWLQSRAGGDIIKLFTVSLMLWQSKFGFATNIFSLASKAWKSLV
jgi:hypothetical protein